MKKSFMIALLLLCSILSFGREIKVSLAKDIPPDVVSPTEGLLVDLISELNKVSGDVTFKIIGTFPFKRSINNVEKGVADLHLPLLEDPDAKGGAPTFAYTEENFTDIPFVLYTKSSQINESNYSKHNVAVQIAHKGFFPGTRAEMPIDGGIKRVALGGVDGYICAMISGNEALEKNNIKGMKKVLVKVFKSKAIVANNASGKEIDKIFSENLKKLKSSGKLYEIYPKMEF